MKYFTIIHTHRHGTDNIIVKTKRELPLGWYSNDAPKEVTELTKKLEIDFEPEEESIDILDACVKELD